MPETTEYQPSGSIWDNPTYTEPTDIPGVIRCWQVGRPSWLEVNWDSRLKEQR